MLRLTTKVTRSPASSARSSSAATRISSITSGRVSANSAVSSSSLSSSPSRPLAIARSASPAAIDLFAAPPRPPPRNEAPVLQLDHVENALLHPLGVHVLRVDAEPLGQRIPPRRQLLPHLMRAGKGVLGRDVVAVRGEPPEVRRPRLDQLRPPVRQIRRHLDPDVRHQPLALLDQPLDVLDRHRRSPSRRSAARRAAHRETGTRAPDEPPHLLRGGASPSPAHRSREAASAMSATSAP